MGIRSVVKRIHFFIKAIVILWYRYIIRLICMKSTIFNWDGHGVFCCYKHLTLINLGPRRRNYFLYFTSLWRLCMCVSESTCLVKWGKGSLSSELKESSWASASVKTAHWHKQEAQQSFQFPTKGPDTLPNKHNFYHFKKRILSKARVKESLEICIIWLLQKAQSSLVYQIHVREKTTCGTRLYFTRISRLFPSPLDLGGNGLT